jgi:hypothetical protein
MYFALDVRPGRKVTIALPVTHGFRVPLTGITSTDIFDPRCRCGIPWSACDCADAIYRVESKISPIDPRPVTTVPAVGVFLYSSLAFEPPTAPLRIGQILPVHLVWTFKGNGVLQPGDTLQIKVPNLARFSSGFFEISGPNGTLFENPGWDPSSETLSVYLKSRINFKTTLTFFVDKSVGFQLPIFGYQRDDPSIMVNIISDTCPISTVSVLKSSPVGSFQGTTEIRIFPKHVGEPCTLSLSFRFSTAFQMHDALELKLPGTISNIYC